MNHFAVVAVLSVVSHSLAAQGTAARKVDYHAEIVPLLRKHCVSCHGPKKQKGDLRLDAPEHWTGSHFTDLVRPGAPDESELLRRLTLPLDDDERMPADADPLPAGDVATFRRWIEEGATRPATAAVARLPALDAAGAAAQRNALAALREIGAHAATLAEGDAAVDVNLGLLGARCGDAALARLAGLETSLLWLSLARTAVTDDGVAGLRAFGELERLNLSRTKVTARGVRALAAAPKLTVLNLFGSAVGDDAVDALAAMPALRRVYLWQSAFTATGVAELRKRRPDVVVDFGVGK